jgi:hypothetical protein
MHQRSHFLWMLCAASISFVGCGSNDPLSKDPTIGADTAASASGPASTQTPPVASGRTQQGQTVMACAQLVVSDPAVPLDGIALFSPEQKQGNPEAGDPSYVYLAAGKEGVILPGPSVTTPAGTLATESAAITMVGVRSTSADGYDVSVNASLKYHVSIDDFESEVALAHVELCEQGGEIQSWFVFVGNPGASGVAHRITMTATTTTKVTALQPPVTVEVR